MLSKMRFKKVASVLVLITLISATFGCINSGISGGIAKDVLKTVPDGVTSFNYVNIKLIKEDKDLRRIYKDVTSSSSIEKLGMDEDNLNYIASAGGLTIYKGSFDVKKIKTELKDQGYDKDTYNGVDLWTKKNKYSSSSEGAAVIGDKLIVGDEKAVKNSIKVIKGSDSSAYEDDKNLREVIDKLPDGIMMMGGSGPKNSLALGFSVVKEDKDTLKIRYLIKFKDEEEAEDAMSEIKRDIKRNDYISDVSVKQSGKFIEITAKADIENWNRIQ